MSNPQILPCRPQNLVDRSLSVRAGPAGFLSAQECVCSRPVLSKDNLNTARPFFCFFYFSQLLLHLHFHARRKVFLILACLRSLSLGEYIAERGRARKTPARIPAGAEVAGVANARASFLHRTSNHVAVIRQTLPEESGRGGCHGACADGVLWWRCHSRAGGLSGAGSAVRFGRMSPLELEGVGSLLALANE